MKQISVTKEIAVVGLRVVRGPDWNYIYDQDKMDHARIVIPSATGIGSIVEVRETSVSVKWDSGLRDSYSIKGKYDLYIYSPMSTPVPAPASSNVIVTRDNAYVGMKVKKGADWRWGDQDTRGGGEGIGEITGIGQPQCSEGWVRVIWDKIGSAVYHYRVGDDNSYDLYMYSPSGEVGTETVGEQLERQKREIEIRKQRSALEALSGSIMKQKDYEIEKSLKPNKNGTDTAIKVRRPISTIQGPKRRTVTGVRCKGSIPRS